MDVKQPQRNGMHERPGLNKNNAQNSSGYVGSNAKRMPHKTKVALGGLLVLVLLVAVLYNLIGLGSPVDSSKYQAVFLENGQVYFGKLSGWGGPRPMITDVYYFQATGTTTEGNPAQAGAQNNTQTLIKLGEEVHKPSDKLILNRDAILFVENIEDDGQVVQAIKKNKAK